MNLTLFPTHEAGLPEGMTHPARMPCPFEPHGYPKGRTCCSFDATAVQEACLRYCSITFAALMNRDLTSTAAEGIAQTLRECFVNAMVFHSVYAEKTVNPRHPMVKTYDAARARGEDYPDWSFDRFAAEIMPVGQASEWLIQIAKLHHGVRFAG